MKPIRYSLLVLVASALVSCVPEERVWWSPDGQTAVVRSADALHLADPGGSLGPALDLGGKLDSAIPGGVDWLPDNNGFIFARTRPAAHWDEAKALIPATDAKVIEDLARILPGIAATAIQASEEKSLKAAFEALPLKSSPLLQAAVGVAWENDPVGISKLLSPLADGQPVLDALSGPDGKIQIHEICRQMVANGQASGSPEVLVTNLRGHGMVQVSPDGKLAACFRVGMEENSRELVILPLAGGQEVSVAGGTGLSFAWAPDSHALILARPVGLDGPLSTIDRLPVCDAAGNLLTSRDAPPSVPLVRAVLLDGPAISVLPDGRVFFASTVGSWPAAANTRDSQPKLFLAAADGSEVKEIPCAPGTLPMDLRFHVLSPDGKHAALVESGSSAVAVVDLATGEVNLIEAPVADWDNHSLPAWRGNTEMIFAAVRFGKPTAVRWTAKSGVTPWGQAWPEEITARWMDKRKAKEE